MKRETKVIDGVEYVLQGYKWGDLLDISDQGVEIKMAVGENGKPTLDPIIKTSRMSFLNVLNSLNSWTFRGYDSDGELKKEGNILEINEENLRELPVSHGVELDKIASRLNKMSSIESKNLPVR